MAWFGKKKKKEQQRQEELKHQQELLAQQNKGNGVVSQQKDSFDVDPAFFESDKVKVNEFLTDDKEYTRKVLINDCPNGDFRHLDINTNLLELQSRMEKDELAFDEVNKTMKIREGAAINDFEIAKARAVNALHSEEPQFVNSSKYSEKQLNQYGKAITKQMKHISAQTESLLKAEHTKILDLNDINETIISRPEYMDVGGTETIDPYNSTDGGVNKFNTLMKIHDDNTKMSKNYNVGQEAISDLQELKVNNQVVDNNSLPSRPLTKRLTVNSLSSSRTNSLSNQGNDRIDTIPEQIVAPRNPTRTVNLNNINEEHAPRRQQTVQLNPLQEMRMVTNSRTSTLYSGGPIERRSTTLNEPAQLTKIDDLLVKDIEEKTNRFMNTRSILTEENINANNARTMNYNRTRPTTTTSSLYRNAPVINNDRLIPFNEVKMDHRVRKSQRREFKFINGGSF